MINVRIDTEESLEDSLHSLWKILREGYSYLRRKSGFVVQLVLNPGHEGINIIRGRETLWFLRVAI